MYSTSYLHDGRTMWPAFSRFIRNPLQVKVNRVYSTSYLHDGRTMRPAAGEAKAGKGEAHGGDGERFSVGGGEEGETDDHPAPGEGEHGGEAAGAVEEEAGEGGEEEHQANHDRAAERHGPAPYVELGGHRDDVHLWEERGKRGGACGCSLLAALRH